MSCRQQVVRGNEDPQRRFPQRSTSCVGIIHDDPICLIVPPAAAGCSEHPPRRPADLFRDMQCACICLEEKRQTEGEWTGCRAARMHSRETLLITPSDREVIRLQNMYSKDGDAQASAGSCRTTVIFVKWILPTDIGHSKQVGMRVQTWLQKTREIGMSSCMKTDKGLMIGMGQGRTQSWFV